MIKRVLPYSLRGFIWYQGESDDHKPRSYEKLFGTLIHKWREDWNDEKLPFLFVQLPVHRYKQDKDFKHWCLIRQAQEKVFTGIKNTGMACALDLGDFNDIHPRGKKVVAERLALAMNLPNGTISTAWVPSPSRVPPRIPASATPPPASPSATRA